MTIPSRLRRQVVERACGRCEYCSLSQEGQEATFHVDHVVPIAVDGPTTLDNLALACVSCSLRKGARQIAPDPQTGADAPLFNPRRDVWWTHFRWKGACIVGLTPTGRATVVALNMNRPLAQALRAEKIYRHPPSIDS